MASKNRQSTRAKRARAPQPELIDPRRGDIEDDASSTKRRSMLSLFGSLLVEISLPKLIIAWIVLLVVPGLLLGLAPIVFVEWLTIVTDKLASLVIGLWSLLILGSLIAVAWFGWRALFRMAEKNFWALNSIVVEPSYAAFREAFRQLAERLFARNASDDAAGPSSAPRLRRRRRDPGLPARSAGAVAGLAAHPSLRQHLGNRTRGRRSPSWRSPTASPRSPPIWPSPRWSGALPMPPWRSPARCANSPRHRKAPAFGASLISPTSMWSASVYGFRVESGRSGPRGNDRLRRLLDQLETLDAKKPFDTILITGDMTDAGISSEWAELLDALAAHPSLQRRVLMLPGNHDLNIVDRSNPARMDLPTSPDRRLRQLRTLSAMNAVHGDRVRVVDRAEGRLGGHARPVLEAASRGDRAVRRCRQADLLQGDPRAVGQRLPHDRAAGRRRPGSASSCSTPMPTRISPSPMRSAWFPPSRCRPSIIACAEYPRAAWIVALHHHLMEYPWAAKQLSMRIGTALINGNWFVRSLKPLTGRAVLMHGHRHVDWIGQCAGLPIISAPSPVMEVTDDKDTAFYIHTLAIDAEGRLSLLTPERIVVPGEPAAKRRS